MILLALASAEGAGLWKKQVGGKRARRDGPWKQPFCKLVLAFCRALLRHTLQDRTPSRLLGREASLAGLRMHKTSGWELGVVAFMLGLMSAEH